VRSKPHPKGDGVPGLAFFSGSLIIIVDMIDKETDGINTQNPFESSDSRTFTPHILHTQSEFLTYEEEKHDFKHANEAHTSSTNFFINDISKSTYTCLTDYGGHCVALPDCPSPFNIRVKDTSAIPLWDAVPKNEGKDNQNVTKKSTKVVKNEIITPHKVHKHDPDLPTFYSYIRKLPGHKNFKPEFDERVYTDAVRAKRREKKKKTITHKVTNQSINDVKFSISQTFAPVSNDIGDLISYAERMEVANYYAKEPEHKVEEDKTPEESREMLLKWDLSIDQLNSNRHLYPNRNVFYGSYLGYDTDDVHTCFDPVSYPGRCYQACLIFAHFSDLREDLLKGTLSVRLIDALVGTGVFPHITGAYLPTFFRFDITDDLGHVMIDLTAPDPEWRHHQLNVDLGSILAEEMKGPILCFDDQLNLLKYLSDHHFNECPVVEIKMSNDGFLCEYDGIVFKSSKKKTVEQSLKIYHNRKAILGHLSNKNSKTTMMTSDNCYDPSNPKPGLYHDVLDRPALISLMAQRSLPKNIINIQNEPGGPFIWTNGTVTISSNKKMITQSCADIIIYKLSKSNVEIKSQFIPLSTIRKSKLCWIDIEKTGDTISSLYFEDDQIQHTFLIQGQCHQSTFLSHDYKKKLTLTGEYYKWPGEQLENVIESVYALAATSQYTIMKDATLESVYLDFASLPPVVDIGKANSVAPFTCPLLTIATDTLAAGLPIKHDGKHEVALWRSYFGIERHNKVIKGMRCFKTYFENHCYESAIVYCCSDERVRYMLLGGLLTLDNLEAEYAMLSLKFKSIYGKMLPTFGDVFCPEWIPEACQIEENEQCYHIECSYDSNEVIKAPYYPKKPFKGQYTIEQIYTTKSLLIVTDIGSHGKYLGFPDAHAIISQHGSGHNTYYTARYGCAILQASNKKRVRYMYNVLTAKAPSSLSLQLNSYYLSDSELKYLPAIYAHVSSGVLKTVYAYIDNRYYTWHIRTPRPINETHYQAGHSVKFVESEINRLIGGTKLYISLYRGIQNLFNIQAQPINPYSFNPAFVFHSRVPVMEEVLYKSFEKTYSFPLPSQYYIPYFMDYMSISPNITNDLFDPPLLGYCYDIGILYTRSDNFKKMLMRSNYYEAKWYTKNGLTAYQTQCTLFPKYSVIINGSKLQHLYVALTCNEYGPPPSNYDPLIPLGGKGDAKRGKIYVPKLKSNPSLNASRSSKTQSSVAQFQKEDKRTDRYLNTHIKEEQRPKTFQPRTTLADHIETTPGGLRQAFIKQHFLECLDQVADINPEHVNLAYETRHYDDYYAKIHNIEFNEQIIPMSAPPIRSRYCAYYAIASCLCYLFDKKPDLFTPYMKYAHTPDQKHHPLPEIIYLTGMIKLTHWMASSTKHDNQLISCLETILIQLFQRSGSKIQFAFRKINGVYTPLTRRDIIRIVAALPIKAIGVLDCSRDLSLLYQTAEPHCYIYIDANAKHALGPSCMRIEPLPIVRLTCAVDAFSKVIPARSLQFHSVNNAIFRERIPHIFSAVRLMTTTSDESADIYEAHVVDAVAQIYGFKVNLIAFNDKEVRLIVRLNSSFNEVITYPTIILDEVNIHFDIPSAYPQIHLLTYLREWYDNEEQPVNDPLQPEIKSEHEIKETQVVTKLVIEATEEAKSEKGPDSPRSRKSTVSISTSHKSAIQKIEMPRNINYNQQRALKALNENIEFTGPRDIRAQVLFVNQYFAEFGMQVPVPNNTFPNFDGDTTYALCAYVHRGEAYRIYCELGFGRSLCDHFEGLPSVDFEGPFFNIPIGQMIPNNILNPRPTYAVRGAAKTWLRPEAWLPLEKDQNGSPILILIRYQRVAAMDVEPVHPNDVPVRAVQIYDIISEFYTRPVNTQHKRVCMAMIRNNVPALTSPEAAWARVTIDQVYEEHLKQNEKERQKHMLATKKDLTYYAFSKIHSGDKYISTGYPIGSKDYTPETTGPVNFYVKDFVPNNHYIIRDIPHHRGSGRMIDVPDHKLLQGFREVTNLEAIDALAYALAGFFLQAIMSLFLLIKAAYKLYEWSWFWKTQTHKTMLGMYYDSLVDLHDHSKLALTLPKISCVLWLIFVVYNIRKQNIAITRLIYRTGLVLLIEMLFQIHVGYVFLFIYCAMNYHTPPEPVLRGIYIRNSDYMSEYIMGGTVEHQIDEKYLLDMKAPNATAEVKFYLRGQEVHYDHIIQQARANKFTPISYLSLHGQTSDPMHVMATSDLNTISALLCRAVKPRTDICPIDLLFYKDFTEQFLKKYLVKPTRIISCSEYIEQVDEGPKRTLYRKTLEGILNGDKLKTSYTGFMKTRESSLSIGRPRFLTNPPDCWKVISGAVNYNIIHALKQTCPGFCHGFNNDQLQERINKLLKNYQDPVFISLDGSAFDSTQYEPLLQAIDVKIVDFYLPIIYPHLGLYKFMYPNIRKHLRNTTCRVKMYWQKKINKRTQLMADLKLRGTVTSGDPLRTTLGNTMRLLSYLEYIAHLAGINASCLVAGDDGLIIVESRDAPHFAKYMDMVYVKDGECGGLGQICKEYNISSYKTTFLSKDILRQRVSTTVASRKPDRFAYTGESVDPSKIIKKYTLRNHRDAVLTSMSSMTNRLPHLEAIMSELPKYKISKKLKDWEHHYASGISEFDGQIFLAHYKEYVYTMYQPNQVGVKH